MTGHHPWHGDGACQRLGFRHLERVDDKGCAGKYRILKKTTMTGRVYSIGQ